MNKSFDSKWEEVHAQKAWGKYPSEQVVRFIARNFYNTQREQIKILDLGCGAGANTFYMANEGFDCYAVDGSESAIKKTREYLESNGLNANLHVDDFSTLSFKDNFFDCVIDSAAMYANPLEGIKSTLKEVYRVLKNKGLFFSTGLFTMETTGAGTGEKIEEYTYVNEKTGKVADVGTIHYFTKDHINELYTASGFKIISIDHTKMTEDNGKNTVAFYTCICKK